MPGSPGHIREETVTDDTITMGWARPPGRLDKYEVTITPEEQRVRKKVALDKDAQTYTFWDLTPATKYIITLKAIVSGTAGQERCIEVQTREL